MLRAHGGRAAAATAFTWCSVTKGSLRALPAQSSALGSAKCFQGSLPMVGCSEPHCWVHFCSRAAAAAPAALSPPQRCGVWGWEEPTLGVLPGSHRSHRKQWGFSSTLQPGSGVLHGCTALLDGSIQPAAFPPPVGCCHGSAGLWLWAELSLTFPFASALSSGCAGGGGGGSRPPHGRCAPSRAAQPPFSLLLAVTRTGAGSPPPQTLSSSPTTRPPAPAPALAWKKG